MNFYFVGQISPFLNLLKPKKIYQELKYIFFYDKIVSKSLIKIFFKIISFKFLSEIINRKSLKNIFNYLIFL